MKQTKPKPAEDVDPRPEPTKTEAKKPDRIETRPGLRRRVFYVEKEATDV